MKAMAYVAVRAAPDEPREWFQWSSMSGDMIVAQEKAQRVDDEQNAHGTTWTRDYRVLRIAKVEVSEVI